MPLFVVETISQFRTRYIIDCQEADHAEDTVTMNEADEFSQMHLGETILTTREITYEEFTRMNKALEQYGDGTKYRPESGSPWMGDQMIHRVDYGN
jgi:hypothetical protein